MTRPETCILVADSAHARLFRVGSGGEWFLLEELSNPAGRAKGVDLVTDVVEKDESPREVESERFARILGDLLDRFASQNVYRKLILVAPPGFLGMLRNCLSPQVEKRVVDELAKDFARMREDELSERVSLPVSH